MSGRSGVTYEQEEAALVEEFRSGDISLEELENALEELRENCKDIEGE